MKKNNLKLHRNDKVLDLEMEIEGTDDMSIDDSITDFIKGMKLETRVTPEEFHSTLPSTKDIYPPKKRGCTISNYHWCFMEELRRCQLFRVQTSEMLRGVLSIGIMSNCRAEDIDTVVIDKLMIHCKGERVKRNFKQLDNALKQTDFSIKKDRKFLERLVCSSNKSQYGVHIWWKLFTGYDDMKPQYNKTEIEISGRILEECKLITKDSLALSKACMLKKNPDNQKAEAYVSWRLVIALEELRTKKHPNLKVTEITRMCFISGLFVIAKWIIKKKFCKDEHSYCVIMHKLNRYIAETKT